MEKITFWHDVEDTRVMMEKVMLEQEYGDVFDCRWAADVWVKERKREELLKINDKSEKKAFINQNCPDYEILLLTRRNKRFATFCKPFCVEGCGKTWKNSSESASLPM